MKIEIELMRKAAVLYVLSAESLLMFMVKNLSRGKAQDEEYVRRRSDAVVAARTAGQADIVEDIMSVDAQIQAAWAAHGALWKGIAGDTAKISLPRQDAFLESLADCIVGLRRATDRLDATAGLHKPINTSLEHNWHPVLQSAKDMQSLWTKKHGYKEGGYHRNSITEKIKEETKAGRIRRNTPKGKMSIRMDLWTELQVEPS